MLHGIRIAENSKFSNSANFLLFATTWSTELHLTGSRYFGGATDESDFDFFAERSDFFISKLTEQGFTRLFANEFFNSSYSDTNLEIYQKCLDSGEIIQIQVLPRREDVVQKINAQKFLIHNFNFTKISKIERKMMWNVVLRMLDTDSGKRCSNLEYLKI